MAVGIETREGLQNGRCHLEHEGDDAYLGKREAKLILDDGIDRRHHRLNHVVKEVGYTDDDEDGIGSARLYVGHCPEFVSYIFDFHSSIGCCAAKLLFFPTSGKYFGLQSILVKKRKGISAISPTGETAEIP